MSSFSDWLFSIKVPCGAIQILESEQYLSRVREECERGGLLGSVCRSGSKFRVLPRSLGEERYLRSLWIFLQIEGDVQSTRVKLFVRVSLFSLMFPIVSILISGFDLRFVLTINSIWGAVLLVQALVSLCHVKRVLGVLV